MSMKSHYFIFFIILLSFVSCTPALISTLSWQNDLITIDGNMGEWSNPLRFYDSKSKINYSITNNRRNLYVCMKITDEASQFRVMYAGMEFCIDTMGKKTFPIVLMFPTGNDSRMQDESIEEKKYIAQSDIAFVKQKFLSLVKEMELKGFKPPFTGSVPLSNPNSICASLNWDKSGILVYEAVIPFNSFYKDELAPSDSNKVFNFKIKINALPEDKSHEHKNETSTNQSNADISGNGMTGSSPYGVNQNMNIGNRNAAMVTEFSNSEAILIVNKLKLSYQ